MSKVQIYEWLKAQSLSITHRAVLRVLCAFSNAAGEVWVTVPTLAAEVGCSERTVQYAFRHLERRGLIEDTGRRHVNAKKREIPVYRLVLDFEIASDARSAPRREQNLHRYGRNCVHLYKENNQNNDFIVENFEPDAAPRLGCDLRSRLRWAKPRPDPISIRAAGTKRPEPCTPAPTWLANASCGTVSG